MREPFTTTFMSAAVTASPERAWRALSDGSGASTLVAGVRIVSDWKTGSPVRLDAAGFCVVRHIDGAAAVLGPSPRRRRGARAEPDHLARPSSPTAWAQTA